MSYLVTDLIDDVMPRVSKFESKNGITILGAANSIQSLISKKLLARKSDLLVNTSRLNLIIKAEDNHAQLPSGFISLSEKLETRDLESNWMEFKVTAYNPTNGLLSGTLLDSSGTDSVAGYLIADVTDSNGSVIGATTTTLINGVASVTNLQCSLNMDLVINDVILLYNEKTESAHNILNPRYLSEDKEQLDNDWWISYGNIGINTQYVGGSLSTYKIVNRTVYIKPSPSSPIRLKAKYFGIPSKLINTSEIPWDGLFDEIFREGVVRILFKGISIPEVDNDFMVFFKTEFDSVINSRMNILGTTRTSSSNFM
jgi:hypothetical protein